MPNADKSLLWGTGDPKIILGEGRNTRRTDIQISEYTFDWDSADGTTVLTATGGNLLTDGYIRQGDRLYPTPDSTYFYTISGIQDEETIILTQDFSISGIVTTDHTYQDIKEFRLPHPKEIQIDYIPERADGGETQLQLIDGTILNRQTGFRAQITFEWTYLDRHHFKKLLYAINYCNGGGYLQIIPHMDVPIRWVMFPTAHNFTYTGGQYLGHDASVTFLAKRLIAHIPMISAASNFYPKIT